jgi:hypothetical protein
MTIKAQSIRKGVIIKFNDVEVDKQTVISTSESWIPNNEDLFRKLLKQGGLCKINGIKIEITPAIKVVNSQGNPEVKGPLIDPLSRF